MKTPNPSPLPVMASPLAHLRVLDMGRVLAAPWASQLLSDLGAQVIKIEHPGKGDDTRSWGPPYLKDQQGRDTRESAYYLSANRGKKSLAVDIATPEGQEIIRQLAVKSDILLENFRVGALEKYGLSYADLSLLNPRLIYCSITGYGQKGPLKDLPGYDYMMQAMGGLMSLTGQADGEPGGGPMRVGVPIVDLMTGLYASVAILGAVIAREQTQRGTWLDLSLWDVQISMLANQAMSYLISGQVPQRIGNTHPTIVPYQVFATSDHPLVIAVGNDQQFAKFCQLLHLPELAEDPRFQTNSQRVHHRQILVPLLQAKLLEGRRDEWLEKLQAAKIPCGPILNLSEVFAHPQTLFRQRCFSLPHPLSGGVPMVANPLQESQQIAEHSSAPPLLGQHTEEILMGELGYSQGKIEELRRQRIIN